MANRIPLVLDHHLGRELLRGERVVWCGQPSPLSRAFASGGTFLFGIPFFAFSVFWTWGATGHYGAPSTPDNIAFAKLAWLWGGVFIVVGASMLLSPLWACWVARRTIYAVTDRRAIVIQKPLRRATIQSFHGERLENVIRREAPTGCGDLVFERQAWEDRRGRAVFRDVGFLGILDAHAVQQLLPTGHRIVTSYPVR